MADSLTLTEFVPGTKAKAQEVNANFAALKEALDDKAAIDGDSSQTFSVAEASSDSHAVNKSQLDDLSDDLTAEISKTGAKFCVKSGNTASGEGYLFSYSVLRITPLIGGTYANLIISDYKGTQTTITSVDTISMSGKPDGDYNIFITPAGVLYTLDNTIYKQHARPTMLDGDVWLNTSVVPFSGIKYDGTNDNEFLDVPLGKVTVTSGAISAIETFTFNEDGNNVTSQTKLVSGTKIASSIPNFVMPDYTKGSGRAFYTVYQAAVDGYLHIKTRFNGVFYISAGNPDANGSYGWTGLPLNNFADQGFSSSVFLPIPKNMYYKVYDASTADSVLTFYPCLAV